MPSLIGMLFPFSCSGIKPAAFKALQIERHRLRQQEEFPCDATRALNDVAVYRIMSSSKSSALWSKTLSWVDKFLSFARDLSKQAGKRYSDEQLIASNNMCRHFITHVSAHSDARTRPRSARTALSAYRQRLGFKTLTNDEAISDVVKGHESARPATKRQAAGLNSAMLHYISKVWGSSSEWWKRQCATIYALGFVSLMRLGEIISLKKDGIKVVFKDGSEITLTDLKKMPRLDKVEGLLFHLPWRKNHVAQDCWIPVACDKVTTSVFCQVTTLGSLRSRSPYLFPSRRYGKNSKQIPHNLNHVGHQSVVTALRVALLQCVPLMTKQWASLYSGHSLRVGGSNHMRRLGISDDVHRRLGGWMSLTSSQGYMQLSPQEQFKYTLRLATQQSRSSAFTRVDARRALARSIRRL